jgi:4-aminobutyrate aminotransferase-like enzyme
MISGSLAQRRNRVLSPTYGHFFEKPLHLVRGEGVWLWDSSGEKYLDCYNNVASTGHCHPHVVEALCKQASTLNTNTRYLHEAVVELGEMITAKLPEGLDVCMFVCTGTEANDLAMQIARHVTGNHGGVVTEASYHGNSDLILKLSTDMYPPAERPPWLAVIEPPNLYRGPYTRADTAAGERYLKMACHELDALAARGHSPAALMIDTVWDSNGPLVVPKDYPKALCAEVRARGGLIIADEVQAGYCRTGASWWGFPHYEIVPDIVTAGKPMGAGHPLAMVATSREIAEEFAGKNSYFNTFGGNPVSAQVGKAVIEVIEQENLGENAESTGAFLAAELAKLQEKHEMIGDIQGRGLFLGLDMVTDRAAKTPFDHDDMRHLGSLIAREGLITGTSGRYGQILKLRPPLVFAHEHAEFAVAAIDRALTRFADERST